MKISRIFKHPIRSISALLVVSVLALAYAAPTMALVQNPSAAAKISFTFDDGLESALTQAAPALAQHGLSGTNYITTDCIGSVGTCNADPTADYMTWDQVATLKNTYGWEIGSHTVSHPQLATDGLNATELSNEILGSKQALAAHGYDAVSMASPFGDYDNNTLAVIAKYYSSHRGFHDLDNNIWSYNDYLLTNMQVQSGVTVDQVKARIDDAIANNYWLVLTFHDVQANASTNPEDYQYATADLAAIAAYAQSKIAANQLKNVNIKDGLVKSDTNMFTNATFDNGLSGWTTGGGATIVANNGNNGSYPSPTNSISMTAGTANGFLFSPHVNVDSTATYMVKSFLNLRTITGGELGYYIDEYDAAGNWISGQWIQAKTTPIVMSVNFAYRPTNANVKQASLQIYTTANSGIQAYIDNVEFFNLAGTSTPVPPANVNLLPNSSYDSGLSGGWHADNAAAFTADSANHGAAASPVNSVKLASQATNTHLFAPLVDIDSSLQYTISAFVNLLTMTAGELAIYIDEYDVNGAWISGKYAYAVRNTGSETISFGYVPTGVGVKKAGLQIILTGNSGITGYLDEVQFLAPGSTTPPTTPTTPPTTPTTPPAVPTTPTTQTNLVANGTFDAGMTSWTTDDAANITLDTASHGATTDATNSVKLVSSTVNRHLFSSRVTVETAKTYSITSYLNIAQITSGEVAFYIDEYDAAGNWISGQYKTGVSAVSAGDVTFSYTPTSATVASASLQVIVVGNSGIVAYLDAVRWYQN